MKESLSTRSGRWLKQPGPESFSAFMPNPLPPDPPLVMGTKLQGLLELASRAIGRLDATVGHLPNPGLLLYTYVRKEAVLSSQIEGTQSSLSDLLLFENAEMPGVPAHDVKEVSNYVAALEHGIERLKEGFPLSLRLLKEIHAILLKDTRGADKEPGEFRRSQNWVGGTRPGNAAFVPPPAHEVLPTLGALEKFIHGQPVETPTLIKAGLAHVQFETIHPFLDGNGRLGRLLIAFILFNEQALSHPILYLSLHFKQHRKLYYELLQRVREEGDWEAWMRFYLEGVEKTATDACQTSARLTAMFEDHKRKIIGLKTASGSALQVFELLKQRCMISLTAAHDELQLSFPTVSTAMERLERLGLVKEMTGKKRSRVFCYQPYLTILQQGDA